MDDKALAEAGRRIKRLWAEWWHLPCSEKIKTPFDKYLDMCNEDEATPCQ